MEKGFIRKAGKTALGHILIEVSVGQWIRLTEKISEAKELRADITAYRIRIFDNHIKGSCSNTAQ